MTVRNTNIQTSRQTIKASENFIVVKMEMGVCKDERWRWAYVTMKAGDGVCKDGRQSKVFG